MSDNLRRYRAIRQALKRENKKVMRDQIGALMTY